MPLKPPAKLFKNIKTNIVKNIIVKTQCGQLHFSGLNNSKKMTPICFKKCNNLSAIVYIKDTIGIFVSRTSISNILINYKLYKNRNYNHRNY